MQLHARNGCDDSIIHISTSSSTSSLFLQLQRSSNATPTLVNTEHALIWSMDTSANANLDTLEPTATAVSNTDKISTLLTVT